MYIHNFHFQIMFKSELHKVYKDVRKDCYSTFDELIGLVTLYGNSPTTYELLDLERVDKFISRMMDHIKNLNGELPILGLYVDEIGGDDKKSSTDPKCMYVYDSFNKTGVIAIDMNAEINGMKSKIDNVPGNKKLVTSHAYGGDFVKNWVFTRNSGGKRVFNLRIPDYITAIKTNISGRLGLRAIDVIYWAIYDHILNKVALPKKWTEESQKYHATERKTPEDRIRYTPKEQDGIHSYFDPENRDFADTYYDGSKLVFEQFESDNEAETTSHFTEFENDVKKYAVWGYVATVTTKDPKPNRTVVIRNVSSEYILGYAYLYVDDTIVVVNQLCIQSNLPPDNITYAFFEGYMLDTYLAKDIKVTYPNNLKAMWGKALVGKESTSENDGLNFTSFTIPAVSKGWFSGWVSRLFS